MSRPTHILLPATARRDPISHGFKVGDRVRAKDRHDMFGVVAVIPRQVAVQIGPHIIGNELGVDLEGEFSGTRAVSVVTDWEKI